MKKNFKIYLIIIIVILIIIFFVFNAYKTVKTGNNITKSTNDFIEYIFNMSSYEAKIIVTVNSNKNTNVYELEQYYLQPQCFKQIVNYPENIKGMEIIYNKNELTIRNTNQGLNKIYQNYNYINDNELWLNTFIKECLQNDYKIEEDENEVIVCYNNKILHIDKSTNLPTILEIKDDNNNTKIYIEYKEIKLNNIQQDNIFN